MLKVIIGFIALFIFSIIYMYIGYMIAKIQYKNDNTKLTETIQNLNEYIHFLQVELISERRSKINVTINEDKSTKLPPL